jgi:HEAT repeat protein
MHAQTALRQASLSDPELFFQAGYRLLESLADSPERARIYNGLLGCPSFLIELTRKDRFALPKLVQICRDMAAIDKRLDIRLAHLLPGRMEDRHHLEPEVVARILELLNEISMGPRLILLLSHLTAHPHPKVAEKATVLMGRRVCNTAWTQRRLETGGPEIRAGVVQGLWGRNTPEARLTMRSCLEDASERVVGNAVFGLHLLREAGVPELVERMMEDERPPFRATAAWLAGQIGEAEFTGLLGRARNDSEASVRLAAIQAMVQIRRSAESEEAPPKTQPAVPDQPVETVAPAKPPETPPVEPRPVKPRPVEPRLVEPAEPPQKPKERKLRIRLDGTAAATRWD